MSRIRLFIMYILLCSLLYLKPLNAQNIPSNGESTQVPEFKYEYAVKFVIGEQKESENLRLAKGLYSTTINIHNPNDTAAIFYKKIALTYPPEEQQAGNIIPISTDTLFYDQALKTDGYDIKNKVKFSTYIEGFIIIQSTVSLDVSAVYTTARQSGCLFRGSYEVASIDIEYIREREIKSHTSTPVVVEHDHFKIYQ